jgi:acetyl esterase/lipase
VREDIAIPPERAGRPAPSDLAERREAMAAAVAAGAFDAPRPATETELAGLRTLRFDPDGPPRGYLLQLHGGGFRIGRPEFEVRLCERLSRECGIATIIPQYRLSPEGPFPAGLNDALAALTALAREAGDVPLLVGGDSAGAGLAAALGVLSAAGNAPRIDGLVLLSPWLDLTVSAPTYETNAASDAMFGTEQANIAAELYLQGFDPTHALASPGLAPVEGFPPALISVGTGEVLFDDSRRFHEKLLAAGVDARLSAIEGMDHVAVVQSFDKPGASETYAQITAFVEAIVSD